MLALTLALLVAFAPQDAPAGGPVPMHATAADTVVVDTTRATIVLDDGDADGVYVTAYWAPVPAAAAPRAHAGGALHDGGAADDGEVRYVAPSATAGRYAVELYWPRLLEGHDGLATNVQVFVRHAGGRADLRADLRAGGNAWHPLGVYTFEGDGYVEVINNSADGVVVVDAVRFVPVR